jgi:hypothetical protein
VPEKDKSGAFPIVFRQQYLKSCVVQGNPEKVVAPNQLDVP